MRSTILSDAKYMKKFIPPAKSRAIIIPPCPPRYPPMAMNSAVSAAISTKTLTLFISGSSRVMHAAGECSAAPARLAWSPPVVATGGSGETFVRCDEGRGRRARTARSRRPSADRWRARGGGWLAWRRDAVLARVHGSAGIAARGELERRTVDTNGDGASSTVARVRARRMHPAGRRGLRVQEPGASRHVGLGRSTVRPVDGHGRKLARRSEPGVRFAGERHGNAGAAREQRNNDQRDRRWREGEGAAHGRHTGCTARRGGKFR